MKAKVFYRIEEASADTKGFVWAAGFGPLPEGMPFLHKTEMELMNRFWKVSPTAPGLLIDPGGNKWPDFLGHGGGSPSFFVTDRVVESLGAIGAPIARVTEIPIGEVKANALKNKPAPRYFVVETMPGIEVDLVATGFRLDAAGKAIVNPPPNPWPWPYRFRASSWSGNDLFAYHHFGPTDGPYTDLLCTERVKELAEREGWTNVRFNTIHAI